MGDSVLLAAVDDLKAIFPLMIVDGEVGRQVYNTQPVIEALKDKKQLENKVLIGLGTNGSFTEQQFDEVMSAVGSERRVYWINVRVPTKRWQNPVNDLLAKMADRYSNLTIVDWYDFSNAHDDWFYEDRVHPNTDGADQYANYISRAVLASSKKSSTK